MDLLKLSLRISHLHPTNTFNERMFTAILTNIQLPEPVPATWVGCKSQSCSCVCVCEYVCVCVCVLKSRMCQKDVWMFCTDSVSVYKSMCLYINPSRFWCVTLGPQPECVWWELQLIWVNVFCRGSTRGAESRDPLNVSSGLLCLLLLLSASTPLVRAQQRWANYD